MDGHPPHFRICPSAFVYNSLSHTCYTQHRRADHRAVEERKKTERWKREIEDKNRSFTDIRYVAQSRCELYESRVYKSRTYCRKQCERMKRQQAKNDKYQKFMLDVLDAHGDVSEREQRTLKTNPQT